MGIDIYFYVERREGDRWVSCDEWVPGEDSLGLELQDTVDPFYHDRDYEVFAILADVYNVDGCNPVARPKGVPDDMCPEVRQRYQHAVEFDCFAATWLSLAEILAFDWDQTVTRQGYAHGPAFYEWVSGRRQQGLSPPDLLDEIRPGGKIATEDEIRQTVDGLDRALEPHELEMQHREALADVYCHVTWTATYRSRAENFFDHAVARMEKLGKPDDVRCVFWFH